ncbi:MAG TPA: 4-hydroxyphenylacetate 3-hydroxylase N-terminal domain-containing protein [Candidatus Binataceae bacterium]|nr:4-hydroxyphenylacetate 3-hydroxylase N-terminal domain-containing protein [Candidatus Binataceae bacterium]
MGARSGSNYLSTLKKLNAEIWLGGERVGEVTSHPAFRDCARSIASLYDMQLERVEQMTFRTDDGGRSGLSFIQPKSIDELRKRSRMMAAWANFSGGMMFRTPDYLNVALAAMASARDFFAASDPRYGDNIANYYLEARKHDWCATLTSIGPGTTFAKTNDGIVVKGTGSSAPLAPFAEELLVFPSTPLNLEHAAIVFAIPSNTKGVRFIFRDDDALRINAARSHFGAPLASLFDVTDCPVIFDAVLVPWQRVFLCDDPARCDSLLDDTSARTHMLHQTAVKNLAKAEFILGLAGRIVEITGTSGANIGSRVWLAEIINATEQVRSCLRIAEADATADRSATMTPSRAPLFASRSLHWSVSIAMIQIVQTMAGTDDITPSASQPEPTDPIERERAALHRIAWDAIASPFAKSQVEFERAHGDSLHMAGDSLEVGDLAPYIERIKEFLTRIG